MLSNDCILLFLIGIAIYFLIKQDDLKPIKNTGSLERNKYISNSNRNMQEISNENMYNRNVTEEYVPNQTRGETTNLLNNTMNTQYNINADNKQMYTDNKQLYDISNDNKQMYFEPDESTVKQQMNDNKRMSFEPDESTVKQQIYDNNKSTIEPDFNINSNNVNTFEPDEINSGASLLTAFNKPLPEGTKTNAVDFNKNYLKSYDSKNYLPQEVNDEWFDTDFTQAKNNIENGNLINTDKYIIGIDTVGQSLKNASWDLRGTIVNPKFSVSPWNNSTYEADYNIKPLC